MRRSSMIVNCTIFNGFLLVCHTKNSDFDHHFKMYVNHNIVFDLRLGYTATLTLKQDFAN